MNYRLRTMSELEEVNEYFMTKRYKARVPQIALMDAEEIAIFGYYQQFDTSGKPMLLTDNLADTNKITTEVLWTIPRLVDAFYNGYPVAITDTDDNCLELFRNLESYIEHNKDAHTLSLNKVDKMDDSFFMQVEHFLQAYLDLNRKTLEYENRTKYKNSGFTLGLANSLVGEALNKSEDKLEHDNGMLGVSNLDWRLQ